MLKQIPQIFEYSFVFAIFEHNLCFSTIRLQPCGLAHAYFSITLSCDAHNWWNILSYQDLKWIMQCTYHHCAENTYLHQLFDYSFINPRPEGYGTCSVIRSFVHSFCPSSCRDERSFLRAGKVMSMTSSTMACNLTRRFC